MRGSILAAVETPWPDSMIAISELEGLIGMIRFSEVVTEGDQYEKPGVEEVLNSPVLPDIGCESRLVAVRENSEEMRPCATRF